MNDSGMGLGVFIGALDTGANAPRTPREEDEYYRRFGNSWALPAWVTDLPAQLRGLGAWAADHRRHTHNA